MQAIKALVIGMGILIILGAGILVYGLTNKFGAPGSSSPGSSSPGSSSKASAAAFGTIRATMPAGASVESVQMQDGSALVHLSLPDGGAQIMVFRLSDGHQTGTIELQPQPQH